MLSFCLFTSITSFGLFSIYQRISIAKEFKCFSIRFSSGAYMFWILSHKIFSLTIFWIFWMQNVTIYKTLTTVLICRSKIVENACFRCSNICNKETHTKLELNFAFEPDCKHIWIKFSIFATKFISILMQAHQWLKLYRHFC